MAKTKTDKSTDKTQNPVSIPVAIRDDNKSGGQKTAADLLAGLTGKAKKSEKKAGSKQKPELALDQDDQNLFVRFAKTKEVFDVVEGELKAVKGELNETLFDSWTDGLWNQKAWAGSPVVNVRDANGRIDATALYIVQEKFPHLQIPDNDRPAESIIEGLIAPNPPQPKGSAVEYPTDPLSEEDARLLVESELDFTPQLSLRPFNELVNGRYEDRQFIESTDEEKAVGQKLLEFVTTQLTEEEQALVLINKPKTVVKKGVLQRLAGYVKSKKQLVRVLQYFVPTNYPKGAKFGVSDNPVARAKRLSEYAAELVGSADLDASDDDD